MNKHRISTLVAIAAAAVTSSTLLANDHHSAKAETTTKTIAGKDIVAVASSSDKFKTLVTAVKAAGLVETLQGKGPFTVFAPTDEAFGKLPEGTVESLLKPENREKLAAILKYHVIPGKVMAADVKTMEAKTVQGQSLNLKVSNEGVMVDNANVIKTDVLADNGVIHVIDRVILPKS